MDHMMKETKFKHLEDVYDYDSVNFKFTDVLVEQFSEDIEYIDQKIEKLKGYQNSESAQIGIIAHECLKECSYRAILRFLASI